MKGIILAGGSGTRLHPATLAINKQLLPIYDKPMIYYPLSVLMLAELRDILIISSPEYIDNYRRLFGDGGAIGVRLEYAIQPKPEGLAQAFLIGEQFLDGDPAALVLGDNIFYGANLKQMLITARQRAENENVATIFGYQVENPGAYGVLEFDGENRVVGIEEKPLQPRSNWAATGLYFYDQRVCDLARTVERSHRGEYEITDLNSRYLDARALYGERLGRGYAWLDTGTYDTLLEAGEFVRTVQKRQGMQIACLEEIAWSQGWIDEASLRDSAGRHGKTGYGKYLAALLD
jgi:glucose-1-phosphate thymidylyltransferase